jgi:hypothetical protein
MARILAVPCSVLGLTVAVIVPFWNSGFAGDPGRLLISLVVQGFIGGFFIGSIAGVLIGGLLNLGLQLAGGLVIEVAEEPSVAQGPDSGCL